MVKSLRYRRDALLLQISCTTYLFFLFSGEQLGMLTLASTFSRPNRTVCGLLVERSNTHTSQYRVHALLGAESWAVRRTDTRSSGTRVRAVGRCKERARVRSSRRQGFRYCGCRASYRAVSTAGAGELQSAFERGSGQSGASSCGLWARASRILFRGRHHDTSFIPSYAAWLLTVLLTCHAPRVILSRWSLCHAAQRGSGDDDGNGDDQRGGRSSDGSGEHTARPRDTRRHRWNQVV